MSKSKIIIVVEIEIEQNQQFYPETELTPEKMLAFDLEAAKDDPYLMMEMENAKWTITGEIIE